MVSYVDDWGVDGNQVIGRELLDQPEAGAALQWGDRRVSALADHPLPPRFLVTPRRLPAEHIVTHLCRPRVAGACDLSMYQGSSAGCAPTSTRGRIPTVGEAISTR